MPKPNKTAQAAIRLLKKLVRYEEATLRLPGSSLDDDDTLKIQLATEEYVDFWIIPLLEALEQGDTNLLKQLLD